MTPDRPTELRERAERILEKHCGEWILMDKELAALQEIVDQEASARSRTDQRKLLERIENFTCDDCKKYPNPENGCWDCMRKLQDNVYAETARLEGEGKE